MLQYSLKSDMELASAIIHKHFSSNAIQSLLKVSENSPEALAMSLALCKDNPECLIEVVGYLLVNINREDSFKNVSLFSMQEFCEDQLETIEINAKLAPSSEFARLAPLKSDLE